MPRQAIKTLITAAHAAELKPWVTLGRRHFLVRGDTAYLSTGIGPVAAAFGLTHFLEDFRPARIVGVGTAGIIATNRFAIGDVVSAQSVATDSNLADVYTPKRQLTQIILPRNAILGRNGAGSPAHKWIGAQVFAPQEISRTEDSRRALFAAGLEVEHLESFAFAFVARKFRCPITLVLGLTNVVGPKAHAEWRVNAERVMKRVAQVVAP